MRTASVLITDDSLVVRAVVRSHLETEGHLVIEAEDGESALEQCRRSPPDIILLDVEMPGLDGYQVLAELKADDDLKDVPVVFLTDRTNMEDVLTGLRGGAHDYLKKPFEPAELVARVAAAIHVKRLQDQLRERNNDLDRLSRTDGLTGLFNRRHLDEELVRHHREATRYSDSFCVLLLDVDHFKHVNDSYGHPAGDVVLCAFAQRLREQLRGGDIAGRWGGEEFLVILPRTDLSGAIQVAERIRRATEESPHVADGREIRVTVSGGCAVGPDGSVGEIIQAVDELLYRAKKEGRNRIIGAAPAALPA